MSRRQCGLMVCAAAALFCALQAVLAVDIKPTYGPGICDAQKKVIEAKIKRWEDRLPKQNHTVEIEFDKVDLGSKAAVSRPGVEIVLAGRAADVMLAGPGALGVVEGTSLGEADNFKEDANGRPTGARIRINDNNSIDWYVDSNDPPATADGNVPAGKYDLWTVINHEICHALGFTVANSRFAGNVTTIDANDPKSKRKYNDEDDPNAILVPAGEGTHLDPCAHPNDLMNPELPPGVRRPPSPIDVNILLHDVWDYNTVDDFEDYNEPNKPLSEKWEDGSANGTGSSASLENDMSHWGRQSMQVGYFNMIPPYYSEVERWFDRPQDWTRDHIRALSLWIRGDPDNAPALIYVELTDYSGMSFPAYSFFDIIYAPVWQEWNIDLREFTFGGVDLTAIVKMAIGVGFKEFPEPSGQGTVWVDDIKLYGQRCIPEYGPYADITGDCVVNYKDVGVMGEQWLSYGYGYGGADLYEDGVVEFKDYCILANSWLERRLWPEEHPFGDSNGDGISDYDDNYPYVSNPDRHDDDMDY